MPEGESLPVPPPEATPQRERLSDEQMGGLLSAVGNNEAKAILFMLMEPHTVYTSGELNQLILKGQGQNPGWNMSRDVPFKYCKKSFVDDGLVEPIEDGLQTTGYMKTDEGGE